MIYLPLQYEHFRNKKDKTKITCLESREEIKFNEEVKEILTYQVFTVDDIITTYMENLMTLPTLARTDCGRRALLLSLILGNTGSDLKRSFNSFF